jgi:hypothetical protein
VLLAAQQVAAPTAMLLDIKGIGPEFAAILWSEGLFRNFDNRRQVALFAINRSALPGCRRQASNHPEDSNGTLSKSDAV